MCEQILSCAHAIAFQALCSKTWPPNINFFLSMVTLGLCIPEIHVHENGTYRRTDRQPKKHKASSPAIVMAGGLMVFGLKSEIPTRSHTHAYSYNLLKGISHWDTERHE